jgi:hypothetical protein
MVNVLLSSLSYDRMCHFSDVPDNFAGLPSILVLLFIKTGLPGVALTLTIGQLISQIFVEEFTLQFMNLYGCEFVIRLSLSAEWIGVCNFSWLLYGTASRFCCQKVIQAKVSDDVYAAGSQSLLSNVSLVLISARWILERWL